MPKVFGWTKKLTGRSSAKGSGQAAVAENSDPECTSSCTGQDNEEKKNDKNDSNSVNLYNPRSHSSSQSAQQSDVKDKPSAFDRRPNFIKKLSPEKHARNPEAKSNKECSSSPEKKTSVEKRHNSDRRPSPEKRLSGEKITSTFARKFASFRIIGSDRKSSDRDSRSKSKSPELEQTNEKNENKTGEAVGLCTESAADEAQHCSSEHVGGAVNGTAASSKVSSAENCTDNGLHAINGSAEDPLENEESSSIEHTEIRSSPKMSRGPGRQSISEKLYGEVIKEFDKIRSTKTLVNKNVSNSNPNESENERTCGGQGDNKIENENGAKQCLYNNNVINSRFTVSAVKEISSEKPVPSSNDSSNTLLGQEKEVEKQQMSVPEYLKTSDSEDTGIGDIAKNSKEVIPSSPESDVKENIQHPLPQAPLAEEEILLENDENEGDVDGYLHSEEKEENSNNSENDSAAVDQVPELCLPQETTHEVLESLSDNTAEVLANEEKEDSESPDQKLNIGPDVVTENVAQHVVQSTTSVSESSNEELNGSCITQAESPKDDNSDIQKFSDEQCHSPRNTCEVVLITPNILITDEDAGSDEPLTPSSEEAAVSKTDNSDRPVIISECTDVIPLELSEPLCTPDISIPEESKFGGDKIISLSSSNQSEDVSIKDIGQPCDTSEVNKEIKSSDVQSDEGSKLRPQHIEREIDQNINFKENLSEEQNNYLDDKERLEVHSVSDNEVSEHSSISPLENDTDKEKGTDTYVQSEDITNDNAISLKKEMLALLDETFDVNKTNDISDENDSNTVTKLADETEESPVKIKVTTCETEEETADSKTSPASVDSHLNKDSAERKPLAQRRLYYTSENESTKDLNSEHDQSHTQDVTHTNGDHPDDRSDESDKKADSRSLMTESYEESSIDGGSMSLSASPTAPRRRKKSHPVPATRSIYPNKCKEDLLPLTNGEGTGKKEHRSISFSSPPPPRPPAPSFSYSLPRVRERSSTAPSKTYDRPHRANSPTNEEHTTKSITSEKVNIPVPAVRTKVSLNPFDSDEDDEPEPSSEERLSQKSPKQSLNPFDSDYEDDDHSSRESTNIQSIKKEQPSAEYNPFDEDDNEEEVNKPIISSDSFPRMSPSRDPPSKTNLNDSFLSASSQSSRTTNEVSTNPFDEDEDEDDVSSYDNSTLSRESKLRQSLAVTGTSPFQRERIRASLPASTGKVYLSKKKRQAPLPPGYKLSDTMSACNTPVPPRSETALLRGESYTSLDRRYLRKNTATSYSTLSLTSPKRAPPPRPPPPKVKSVSLAQLK